MLSCKFLDFSLSNPFVLAAGVGHSEALTSVGMQSNAAIVTTKSCTLEPSDGNPYPVLEKWNGGFINAIGIKNKGANETYHMLTRLKSAYPAKILMVSIAGHSPEEFKAVCDIVSPAGPDLIEVNLSCPNIGGTFYYTESPQVCNEIIHDLKGRTSIPLVAKLGPTFNIADVALACEAGGADAISLINTVPGLIVDLKSRRSVLSNITGGLSGPAIKPIALKHIYAVKQKITIPIIGIGGISNGTDALECILVGATLVAIATAAVNRGIIQVFDDFSQEMTEFLRENAYDSLDSFGGGMN